MFLGSSLEVFMQNERRCIGIGCNRLIHGCFGFVLAGDLVALIEGARTERPREICGYCSILQNWPDDLGIPKGPHYEGIERLA